MNVRDILPYEIKIKYNYLQIEGIYVCTITVTKYREITFLKTIEDLLEYKDISLSFHITRTNNAQLLKKLTNVIANTGAEIKSINKNQIDSNVINSIKSEAEQIKKKIQIDNEQIYLVSTYIRVFAREEKELIEKVRRVINKLYVLQIVARPNNFKQKEGYLATLPILDNNCVLSKYTESVFTESALTSMFPYYTTQVLDKEGVLIGKTNNKLCAIDILSKNNINYNMCVFGASGTGKSYFVKLHIIRNLYRGINQIIIDPEGEYVSLVESLGGKVYSIETYNPLEINEEFAKENKDYLDIKIKEIIEYVKNKYNKKINKQEIIELYQKYGITSNSNSLYYNEFEDKILLERKYKTKFPSLNELLKDNVIKNDINDSFKFESKLYCFHIKSKNIEGIKKEMLLFMPKIKELITKDTLIYFDEIWKCISMGKDKRILEEIYNMFKTLRKRKAGIIAISQDVGDLFAIDEGNFGKSILNNSNFKMFFKMDYSDVEKIKNIMLETDNIMNDIILLERGSAIVKHANSQYKLEIIANNYENKLIEGRK